MRDGLKSQLLSALEDGRQHVESLKLILWKRPSSRRYQKWSAQDHHSRRERWRSGKPSDIAP